MSSVSFDDFDNDDFDEGIKSKPLWSIKMDDEEDLLKWMNDDYKDKERRAFSRNRTYRQNICLYKGIHYKSQHSRDLQFFQDKRTDRDPKIVINHIYDMVETRVSKLTRFRPAIAVLPANDEADDKNNARTIKDMIDTRWYSIDIDEHLRDLERVTDIFGDGYIHPYWDRQCGDELKAADRLRKSGTTEIENENGEKISLEKRIMTGDVNYRVITPDGVLPENQKEWRLVDHLTHIEYLNIEKLKAMYPDKQEKIKLNNVRMYDLNNIDENSINRDEVMVMTLYHRASEELPKGRIIVATQDVILKSIDLVDDFPHGKLPFIRQSDIDVPNELHGRSFIQIIRQAQRHFNNLSSGIARNHGLASAPKWVVPKGAVNINSLANNTTVVEFKGPVGPKLESYNPTGREVFLYQDKLEGYIEKLSGIHSVSRGAPPPGIKSGVALQFLDEQENERAKEGRQV